MAIPFLDRRGPTALCVAVLIAALAAPAQAQVTGSVQGTVTGSEGQPLASVQVFLQGTRYSSLTNLDGRYQIVGIPAGQYTVVAQRIGFQTGRSDQVSIAEGETTALDFQLAIQAFELDELVVTGVTEATARANLPFTVSRVSAEEMPVQPRTALGSIAGRTAGVSIVPSTQPGTSDEILLRTPTSISRSNEPLIVVDGVIVTDRTMDISSMDIESIEVVKGAAAASLYGSRAASGVLQIRTRRGTDAPVGRTQFTVRSEIGINEVANPIGFNTHHNFLMDAQGNFIGDDGQVVPDRFLATTTRFAFVDQPYPGPTFNPIEALFDPGMSQIHTASIAHNTGTTGWRLTTSRQDDSGVVEGHEGYQRTDFRLNVDHRPTDDLSLAVSAFHMRSIRDDMAVSGPGIFFDFINQSTDVDLTQPDPDGTPFSFQPDLHGIRTNPLYHIHNETDIWEATRTMGGADLRYYPVRWLSLDGNVSYDRSDRLRTVWVPRGVKTPDRPDGDPGFSRRDSRLTEGINASAGASFNQSVGALTVRSVFRGLVERQDEKFVDARGSDASVGGIPDLGANRSQFISSIERPIRSEGYFGTLELGYDDRYLLNTLVRRDGSSLFGPEQRWHTYYRMSGGWRMANEAWWPFPAVNEFRLRASQGTAGGRPNWADRFEVFTVGTGGTLELATLGNERLRPEKTTERELGIDVTTHNRFSVSLVYATQRTVDQLVNVPLPRVFGFSSQWLNAGTIEGYSVELESNLRVIETPGFSWSVGFVADRARNRITEFDRPCYTTEQQRRCAGERIGRFVGNQWAKSFDHISNLHSDAVRDHFQVNDDGLLVAVGSGNSWQDGVAGELWGTSVQVEGRTYEWGMPIIRLDDEGLRSLHVNGDANPDVRFGFNSQVRWRNLQLHVLFDGQIGGDVENRTQQRQTQWLRSELVDQSGKAEERKKPAGYYVAYLYDGNRRNDWWIEPADHLRVRELSASYRLDPTQLAYLESLRIDHLTLSVVGRNLLVLHKDAFTGWDPVAGSATNAQESFGYPAFRTISFRAEVGF